MAIQRRDDWLTTPQGQALPGAQVYYCTQPATTGAIPPAPLATVYSSSAGAAGVNPQATDGFGHAVAYLDNSALYTLVFVHPLLAEPQVLTDQSLGGGGGGSVSAFSQVPGGAINGVNTTFTLTVTPLLLVLTLNGVVLTPGLSYVLNGSAITFSAAPQAGDTMFAQGILP